MCSGSEVGLGQVWKGYFPKGRTLGTDAGVRKHTTKLSTTHNLVLLNGIWMDTSQRNATYVFNRGVLYFLYY